MLAKEKEKKLSFKLSKTSFECEVSGYDLSEVAKLIGILSIAVFLFVIMFFALYPFK